MLRFHTLSFIARFGVGSALLVAATACHKDNVADAPATVTFTQTGLYPEGTLYDSRNNHFLVSSQTAGRIGQVTDDGTYSQFVDDPQLISTIGLNYDANRNRVLAAVSDPGYNTARTTAATLRKLAAVAIFDATTGAKTGYYNLGALATATAPHFANDIAVDDQGNAYVTDSFAPIIYRIDAQGTASVFLTNAAFSAPAGTFGLNGIVFNRRGYLLVAKSDEGAIIKVPIASPSTFTKVAVTGFGLTGCDGLQMVDETTLLVSCNSQSRVYRVASGDNFANASVSGAFNTAVGVYPTTLAQRGSESYVLYSYLNSLQNMVNPPVSQFSLVKTTF